MNQKKLRIGIIGLGRISITHLSAIIDSEYAQIVAVCDIIEELAISTAKKYGCNYYVDYKEMINSENLDAVHVLLPHHLHVPVSIYAMEHGVDVLCEKPISVNYETALQAVECSERLNRNFGIIFQSRYNNSARFIKSKLESGKLGKIISVSSVLTWNRTEDYYKIGDWRGTWDKEGGGVIINQTIHSIDLVNYLVNSPYKSVKATMANRIHPSIEVEDTAEGLIEYENGVKYLFYATNNYGDNTPIEIRLTCENGNVLFNYDDALIEYKDGSKEEAHQLNFNDYVENAMNYWGVQHKNQINQFYRSVLGLEKLEVTGREALKTQKLIDEIYKSGRKNFTY